MDKCIPYIENPMKYTPEIELALAVIKRAKFELEDAQDRLKRLRERCPHKDVNSWTNNDGDGQFIVNLCLNCGLQKDGPLK